MSSSASTNLPFLVGHRFEDPYKTNFHKNQAWVVSQNTCIEKPMNLEKPDKAFMSTLSIPTSTVTSDRLKCRETLTNESFPKTLPQWIKYDKRVLKFMGYFVEHVVESAYENYRIRKCNIFFYLDDDTMHIDEVREENSGIVQGYFVKRQRVEKEGQPNVFITWKDLNLRSEIFLFGKKFRICMCDDFTRKFYEDKGIKLNECEPIPEINYEDKFKNVDFGKNKQNIAELKEYIEVGLGGGHPNKGLKQFIENDRKVLNFDISWFDDQYDKEEKVYKMNYYLADSMVEVREIKVSNSGKDPFPLLLHKSKLPKNPQFSYCPGLIKKDEEYYQPEDLVLGNYVYAFNRPCRIIDCDEVTKKWYKEK
jgi:hypothetical protein